MLYRLYLVFFIAFFTDISVANDASWNCQQDKSTKQWACVGSSASTNQAPAQKTETKTPESGSKPVAIPEPAEASTTNDVIHENKELTDVQISPIEKPEAVGVESGSLAQDEAPLVQKNPIAVPNHEVVNKAPDNKTVIPDESLPVLPASQKPGASKSLPSAPGTVVAADSGKTKGWNCDTKGKDGNWNCQLVGPDPKGEPRVVEAEREGFHILEPAFDNKQELVFSTLQQRFKVNPWANCTIKLGRQPIVSNKKLRDKADLDMNSNYSEIFDNEVGNYEGNVEMKRADQQASSNAASYDSISETLDLHGNVYYSEDELALFTESATLKLASDEARLRNTLFVSPATPLRGKAEAIYRDSETFSRYKGVAYTACVPGNQDWVVHADALKMNKKSGNGSAKNAWVEFKGVPIFYSPYLSFPLDDRRLSGFLAPSFGNTQRGGFNLSVPFYWNIAPNYDATLRPRYYTKRGVMLAGDFRYLTERSKGSVGIEYMPHDKAVTPDDPIRTTSRYSASVKNTTHFSPHISSNMDLNVVSDKFYFADLGNALSFPNFSHVRSQADISYLDEGISLIGRVENYQTIDPNLTGRLRPYRRLPQLNLNLNHTFESIPLDTGLNSEYVFFQHDKSSPTLVNGQLVNPDSVPDGHRFNVEPYVSLPWTTDSAYVTPKLSLKYTQYLLENQDIGKPDTISRVLPIASVDSGMFFEKDVNVGGSSLLHTLEPRLFYLYIPRTNQNDIPIFDTSFYDFSFYSLFRENRFSGTDRVQDANQITPALTTRLVDPKSGLERLRLSIGDIFYFEDREVTAPLVRIGRRFLNSRVETSSFSPLVGEMSSQLNEHISVEAGMQWDSEHNDVVRGKALFHYVNDPGEIINIGYVYRKNRLIQDTLASIPDDQVLANELLLTKDEAKLLRTNNTILRSNDIIQSDISFHWPIADDWFAIGKWQYSLLYNQTQDAFFGFEKETCCWRFRIIGRRYINNFNAAANSVVSLGTPANSNTGIYFQLELKGLTGIGEQLGDFFTKSIYGYRKSED